jgi:osmotically-inducible protein OsmY
VTSTNRFRFFARTSVISTADQGSDVESILADPPLRHQARWLVPWPFVLLAASALAQPEPQPTGLPGSLLAARIERMLREELPGLHRLRVTESLGLVTLSALAPSLPMRRRAVALVRETPGVLEVLDLIAARPRGREDRLIHAELLQELERLGPRVSAVSVHVEDGIVRLSGALDSLALRLEVDELAAGAAGVRDVANELRVEPLLELPAQSLPEDVAWSLPFDSSTVTMLRQGDSVTLRGKLLSQDQVERLVRAMLRLPGVQRVQSEIEVKNPFERLPGLHTPR